MGKPFCRERHPLIPFSPGPSLRAPFYTMIPL
jgi:hypothetical protein